MKLQKGGSDIVKQIGDYTITTKDILGQGSFGIVYKCTDKQNVVWAAKQISKSLIKEKKDYLERLLRQEVGVQKQMKSQNVVRLKEFLITENNYYLILDYCNAGNLKQQIQKEKRFSETKAKEIMSQIINGLREMNERSIVHRDIKPDNILVAQTQEGLVYKIGDFGFAKNMSNDDMIKSQVGTPLYMDPQILLGKPYDNKCDIWSVGIIFYEMLYGTTPWPKVSSQYDLLEKIKYVPIRFIESISVSEKARSLINRMLQKEPSKRISYAELLEDSYFKKPKFTMIFPPTSKEQQNNLNSNEKELTVEKPQQNQIIQKPDINKDQQVKENQLEDQNDENVAKVYQLIEYSKQNFESFSKKIFNMNCGCLDQPLFQQFVEQFLGQGDYSKFFEFVLKLSSQFNIKKSSHNQQKVLLEDLILLFKSYDKEFQFCIQQYLKSQNLSMNNTSTTNSVSSNKEDSNPQQKNPINNLSNNFTSEIVNKQNNDQLIVVPHTKIEPSQYPIIDQAKISEKLTNRKDQREYFVNAEHQKSNSNLFLDKENQKSNTNLMINQEDQKLQTNLSHNQGNQKSFTNLQQNQNNIIDFNNKDSQKASFFSVNENVFEEFKFVKNEQQQQKENKPANANGKRLYDQFKQPLQQLEIKSETTYLHFNQQGNGIPLNSDCNNVNKNNKNNNNKLFSFNTEMSLDENLFSDLQKNVENILQVSQSSQATQLYFNNDNVEQTKDEQKATKINNDINQVSQKTEQKPIDPFSDLPDPFAEYKNKFNCNYRSNSEFNFNFNQNNQNQQNSQDLFNTQFSTKNNQVQHNLNSKAYEHNSKSSNNILYFNNNKIIDDSNKENVQNMVNQQSSQYPSKPKQTNYFYSRNASISHQSLSTNYESQAQFNWERSLSNEIETIKQRYEIPNNNPQKKQITFNDNSCFNEVPEVPQSVQGQDNEQIQREIQLQQLSNQANDIPKQETLINPNYIFLYNIENNNIVNDLQNYNPNKEIQQGLQSPKKAYQMNNLHLEASPSVGDEAHSNDKHIQEFTPNKLSEKNYWEEDLSHPNIQTLNTQQSNKNFIQNPLHFLPHSNNINNQKDQQNPISTGGFSYIFFN